ncbi:E3 UFM1-protein ligase 1 homolog [Dreissena polymorpha]|uniref:E3 UFM1-protein ligase 1 homolog n=1 Tax=Dreissena polymorpha TaxID=45954 RepID=UPI002264E986|nr:E3 UFM1-protein ligase 1 homolog [Dreissena polymorpha]
MIACNRGDFGCSPNTVVSSVSVPSKRHPTGKVNTADRRFCLSTRLSERNVIEIVAGLIERGLLEVIYTVDGKEYITPQELKKEIKEELLVHGGRINLVELSQVLNVDFSHVEGKATEVVYQDSSLSLVLGQLIHRSYLDRLAEEVNDTLQDKGHVTIPDLTKQYDLPAEFIAKNLLSRLGTIVKGQVDSYDKNVIFTDAFIARMRAQIRGAFSAITRPIQIGTLLHQYRFQERMFYSIVEDLVKAGRLAGSLSGGRQDKATYIPHIYTKSQNNWVDSFYKQNGYLEYDAMKRQGISDPKDFIRKRFPGEPIVYLSTCCVGRGIQDGVETAVEEALETGTWVDIKPILPSILSAQDASSLLTGCLRKHPGALVCCDTIVASEKLISQCSKPFPDLMAQKAEKDAKSHPVFKIGADGGGETRSKETKDTGGGKSGQTKDDRKDQRRQKAVAGSGSTKTLTGTQGREIKTKSLKKKGHKSRDDLGSDEEVTTSKPKSRSQEIEFMTLEEIEGVLRKEESLKECPEELVAEIAQQLLRPLTKQYQEVAHSVFLQSTGTAASRKKTHGQLQDRLTALWTNARLFEKGLKLMPEDVQEQLVRHLLRTVCTDITNLVLNAVATDHMHSVEDETLFTTEQQITCILWRTRPTSRLNYVHSNRLHSFCGGQDPLHNQGMFIATDHMHSVEDETHFTSEQQITCILWRTRPTSQLSYVHSNRSHAFCGGQDRLHNRGMFIATDHMHSVEDKTHFTTEQQITCILWRTRPTSQPRYVHSNRSHAFCGGRDPLHHRGMSIATDHMNSVEDETHFTTESRLKLIPKLPEPLQTIMGKLNSSLNGKSLDEFFGHLDLLCGPAHLGILLRKPDKKKEKPCTHRQTLLEQLHTETDPAMTLHLTCVILFHKVTQAILHLPGRCVPLVLTFLKNHLEPEKFQELINLQVHVMLGWESEGETGDLLTALLEGRYASVGSLRDLVIARLQSKQAAGEGDSGDLEDSIQKVKVIAVETKKSISKGAAMEGVTAEED